MTFFVFSVLPAPDSPLKQQSPSHGSGDVHSTVINPTVDVAYK